MESKEVLGKKDLDRLEKQDKLLKLLKEKKVQIDVVNMYANADRYNRFVTIYPHMLFQDEFDLIKEWLDGK